jgi:uncharacterized membrane protein
MNTIRKILGDPITRLVFWGIIKALVIAPVASLLFAVFIVDRIYAPTFDQNFHLLGTASEFFVFALVFTTVSSIPVSIIITILLAIFLKIDGVRKRISYKRSFATGFLVGGIMGGIGTLIIANQLGDNFLYVIVIILAGIASGVGGMWMTKDAFRLFSSRSMAESN